MKPLRFQDLGVEDQLKLTFEGEFDSDVDLAKSTDSLFEALDAHAGEWIPELVNGKRHRKYSRLATWKSLEERRDENSTSIGFSRMAWPAIDGMLSLHYPPLTLSLFFVLSVQPLSLFGDPDRCRHLVEMFRAWASHYPVTYAFAHGKADLQLTDYLVYGRENDVWQRDGIDKIYELHWLNVFGPKLVETVGRERLLSTPAHRVEALPGGAVLLVLWPTAAEFSSEQARQVQARAFVHLRPEFDFDTVLNTLRERSATLAPVEPRFRPELAPLLSRVVDARPVSQRQRQIAEFNAWQPPVPSEWVTPEEALPPNVGSVEAVCRYYGELSERLVVLLHTQVPSVLKETPESLTDVDFHFWSENYPRILQFEREKLDDFLMPALGAYLGEVLVRNLGGQWVPRQRVAEAQVRVGPRVWWPMVRAIRYLKSQQSVLDYSLTQLYHEARQHLP